MRMAIMQPYFLPYIGYFQLISAADLFVVYDNIKYTKKGWINRNRMLVNGRDVIFSLPIRKDADMLNVADRELSADFNRNKLLNQFRGSYARAPYFAQTWPLLEHIVGCKEHNLFEYIFYSIVKTCRHIGIRTEIRTSSSIGIDHNLKGQDKILALCQIVGADIYINPIGGKTLYERGAFRAKGIELKFIRSEPWEYTQFGAVFVPWLSIADVLMFNSLDTVRKYVDTHFELV